MLRMLYNYLRQCRCNHDFVLLDSYTVLGEWDRPRNS